MFTFYLMLANRLVAAILLGGKVIPVPSCCRGEGGIRRNKGVGKRKERDPVNRILHLVLKR